MNLADVDISSQLKWESLNVPTQDKPNYRIVQSIVKDNPIRSLTLVRTNDNETDRLVSLKTFRFPFDHKESIDYLLVGSADGLILFYVPVRNEFVIWNPVTRLCLTVPGPVSVASAYGFYKPPLGGYAIFAVCKRGSETWMTIFYLQYPSRGWVYIDGLLGRNAEIKGPGFYVEEKLYWGGYFNHIRLDTIIHFDTLTEKMIGLSTNPDLDSLRPYDFLCFITHITMVDGFLYVVVQRHDALSSQLFRIENGSWILVPVKPKGIIIEVVNNNRLILHAKDTLHVMNFSLDSLQSADFPRSRVPFYLVPFLAKAEDDGYMQALYNPEDQENFDEIYYSPKNSLGQTPNVLTRVVRAIKKIGGPKSGSSSKQGSPLVNKPVVPSSGTESRRSSGTGSRRLNIASGSMSKRFN